MATGSRGEPRPPRHRNSSAYWQQIVDTMRGVPGAAFRFEWNPTRGGYVDLASYYPGDAYVDIVGMDVYDTEWATYPGAAAEFAAMETQPYGLDWLATFSAQHDKPMAFPEWGLGWGPSAPGSGPITASNSEVSGGDDPVFVNDMAAWISSHNVIEATFWDYGTSLVGGGQNPQTLGALGADFRPHGPRSLLVELPAVLPEVPSDLALPIVALGLFGTTALLRRRRAARS